jgi:hypothetical protein
LIALTSEQLRADELVQSLERGWSLARHAHAASPPALPLTPVTRLAPPTRIVIPPREDLIAVRRSGRPRESHRAAFDGRSTRRRRVAAVVTIGAMAAAIAVATAFTYDGDWLADATQRIADAGTAAQSMLQRLTHGDSAANDRAPSNGADSRASSTPASPGPEHESSGATAEPTNVAMNDDVQPRPDATPQAPDADAAASKPEEEQAPRPLQESAEATAPPVASTRPSASPTVAKTADARVKSQPSQKPPRATRYARAQPATKSIANAQRARPAETRPSQLAAAAKAKTAINAARASASRGSQTIAKRSANDPIVALPRAPQAAPTMMVASASAAESAPKAVATPQPATIAPAPAVSAVESVATAQNVAVVPSTPTVIASIGPQPSSETQTTVVTRSPPVQKIVPAPEPPRTPVASTVAPAPAPVPSPSTAIASQRPMAPVVELSRPLATPAIPPPKTASPEPARARPQLAEDDDLLAQARWNLGNLVPRTAERARLRIARALYIAANAYHPAQERFIVDAVVLTGAASEVRVAPREIAGADARRLHDEAMRAYAARRVAADAIDLELRAFGANPYDAEIAGQLAHFYLKLSPPQPDRARELALHAIGTASSTYPRGRLDDWMTFAIASALTGRHADSTNALYVSVALARNDERVCRAALNALSAHGERLREPVESLLYRLHAQRRDDDSPSCGWPRSRLAALPNPW